MIYFNTRHAYRIISITNLIHKFFYSIKICMLHYNPQHVSSINMPIFRRTNCIITASRIVPLCKWLYSMAGESRLLCILLFSDILYSRLLLCSLLSSDILYSRLQRETIPDAVIIQFVLLKMGMLMFEIFRGL